MTRERALPCSVQVQVFEVSSSCSWLSLRTWTAGAVATGPGPTVSACGRCCGFGVRSPGAVACRCHGTSPQSSPVEHASGSEALEARVEGAGLPGCTRSLGELHVLREVRRMHRSGPFPAPAASAQPLCGASSTPEPAGGAFTARGSALLPLGAPPALAFCRPCPSQGSERRGLHPRTQDPQDHPYFRSAAP